uniref:PRISE-like Rossmann-fold domain-containing protein n=1 Tax=Chenopodium quinoa TaxID=63459 RepID=A0A803NAF5_CHEQI
MANASVALVVGVTGMAGINIAQALKSPTAQGGPWTVYGAARRAMPTWFPSSAVDHFITFDAVDFNDTNATLAPLSNHITHVFWAAINVGRDQEDNIITNSTMLTNVIKALMPIIGPLSYVIFRYKRDMARLPHPNFYHALEDVVKSYASDIRYTIHRPSIIVGASSRSVYNALVMLAAYAEICKYQNAPFRFFGNRYTWEHFSDMTDTRVLAEQHVWGAVNKKANNQAFNCTNGDVFTWKKMRGVLCEEFGVEFVPLDDKDGLFDLVDEMKDKGKVWNQIVEEKGLVKMKLEEIACFIGFQYLMRSDFQLVSSMNKSKEFGFFGYADSIKSVRFWIGKLREMNIIP